MRDPQPTDREVSACYDLYTMMTRTGPGPEEGGGWPPVAPAHGG